MSLCAESISLKILRKIAYDIKCIIHNSLLYYFLLASSLSGEADQVGADTEAGTLAGRDTDARGEDIQHSENSRSRDGDRQDLIEGQALPGDEDKRQSHGDTLNYILDHASQKVVNVHFIYIPPTDFFGSCFCVSKG